jgi:shikimate kinase
MALIAGVPDPPRRYRLGVDEVTGPPPNAVEPARLLLVGMMGSGKSSVGRTLASLIGWPFVDNDTLVERATGRTARELAEAGGEPALRAAEAAALREAMRLEPPVIASTAAGTILDAANRALIAGGGLVVWLRAPADVLAQRAVRADHRPWLEADPASWFRSALAERERHYAAVADLEIDTSRTDPATAARVVLDRLSAGRTGSIGT